MMECHILDFTDYLVLIGFLSIIMLLSILKDITAALIILMEISISYVAKIAL